MPARLRQAAINVQILHRDVLPQTDGTGWVGAEDEACDSADSMDESSLHEIHHARVRDEQSNTHKDVPQD